MTLELRDVLLLGVRWSHALAAVALVGASAFYLFFLEPAFREAESAATPIRAAANAGFKELVDLTLIVFLISGGLLTFERLSSGAAGTLYAVVLGLKVLLSVFVYHWAFAVRRGRSWASREAHFLVGSGAVVVLLATLLKSLYEGGLRA